MKNLLFAVIAGLYGIAAVASAQDGSEPVRHENSPELVKTVISRMKAALEIDRDSFPELVGRVEGYAQAAGDVPAAVFRSMAAEMYLNYYRQNRWEIDRRTKVAGYVPEDMREWTENHFTDTVQSLLAASLQPAGILQQTPAAHFKEVMETEGGLLPGRQTLYDFLAGRAVELQPSPGLYGDWLAFRRSQPDRRAALLVELAFLQYRLDRRDLEQEACEAALDSLLEAHNGEDCSVEVIAIQLNVLKEKEYRSANSDSILALEYELCKQTLSRFPRYERIALVENFLRNMEQRSISVQSKGTAYPGKAYEIKLHYKNIEEVKVSIYRSSLLPEAALSRESSDGAPVGKPVKELSLRLPLRNTYMDFDTAFAVTGLDEPGLYAYVVTSPGIRTSGLFAVSRLAALSRNRPDGGTDVLAVDFLNGKPVANATVSYYEGARPNPRKLGEAKTGKDGLAQLPPDRKMTGYRVTALGDTALLASPMYGQTDWLERETETETMVSLFTDRGIYRPGQAVFFKGIACTNGENPRLLPNQHIEVILQDASYLEISRQSFTTNEYGSFYGEFTLPRQTLAGEFTLRAGSNSVHIAVEEYRRPGFRVDLAAIREEVAFGDEAVIRGKAETFSGIALASGEVTYRIMRSSLPFRTYNQSPLGEQVGGGTVRIESDGAFSFSFRPEKEDKAVRPGYQSYEVVATVTDSRGETQEGRYSFAVGDRSIRLSTNIDLKVNKDSSDIRITAQTLNRETVSAEGSYRLYLLSDTKEEKEEKEYREIRLLAEGRFHTGEALDKALIRRLPSGRIRLRLQTSDTKGRDVSEQQDFVLYSLSDKRPPVYSSLWLIHEKNLYEPGEVVEFVFGTSCRDCHVLYEVYAGKKNVLRQWLTLDNENRRFTLPFPESEVNLQAVFTFVKDGAAQAAQSNFRRREPDRSLTFRPISFRNRLLPGGTEDWTFRITGADSLPAVAEVLAGMYDASLDKVREFGWRFSPGWYKPPYTYIYEGGEGMNILRGYDMIAPRQGNVPDVRTGRLDWQGMLDMLYPYRTRYGMMYMSKAVRNDILEVEEMEEAESMDAISETPSPQAAGPVASPLPQIRENFNETAFFFPALRTDKEGNLEMRFTLPESNTTWKLQALAHTTALKYGLYNAEVVSQKPFMVHPAIPRFIRQGDEVNIPAQIINQSEQEANGHVRLELFDPEDDRPLGTVEAPKPFHVPPGGTATVSWNIRLDGNESLVGCRIVAESATGSDGEQRLIPVLPGRILVTEATPVFLMDEKEKQVSLPSTGFTPLRTTLEFTANPVWYAVQSLPSLANPERQDMISRFASYYSNTLAAFILQSNPHIRQTVNTWNAQAGTAFLSNLEKNEELKDILLEETPWVADARTEREQKERLTLLFDINRIAQLRSSVLQALSSEQLPGGGWGWFKGMYSSRTITLYILNGMAQLVRLGAVQYDQQEKEMQLKALAWLDQAIREDYASLRKLKTLPDALPSSSQVEYLYVRSLYRDIPEPSASREAIRYFTAQAEKHWEKASLREKGEIALLMHRNGKKTIAANILARLRTTSTTSAAKGMYWANNRREENFFTSPIDVHCLLMEVFRTLGADNREAGRMKQWLLGQKQTQSWESVPSTVNALYSLLATGDDWTAERNRVLIQWGNQTWDTSQGETATGYIKASLEGTAADALSIRKEGAAPAWGAVYSQYFAPISQISKQKGELHVEKMLFRESDSGSGRQLEPVSGSLKAGDKVIVRLTIRAGRDMEYVTLKDARPGCFEPSAQTSGFGSTGRLSYYHSPRDASEQFFFDRLAAGTYVLEYGAYVSRSGHYSSGIATLQCQYAPEFTAHTEGRTLSIDN